MKVYSMGFTKKDARQFFGLLKRNGIKRLLDIRLNNTSQLAGFTKKADLEYFLAEICGAEYRHEPILAPTEAILEAYKKTKGDWAAYERSFKTLMAEREIDRKLDAQSFRAPTVLLCAEATPERCHRRLVLEYLQAKWGDLEVVHL